jgi:hypothetical protein
VADHFQRVALGIILGEFPPLLLGFREAGTEQTGKAKNQKKDQAEESDENQVQPFSSQAEAKTFSRQDSSPERGMIRSSLFQVYSIQDGRVNLYEELAHHQSLTKEAISEKNSED